MIRCAIDPFLGAVVSRVENGILAHVREHLGQWAAYTRMFGIAPPWWKP